MASELSRKIAVFTLFLCAALPGRPQNSSAKQSAPDPRITLPAPNSGDDDAEPAATRSRGTSAPTEIKSVETDTDEADDAPTQKTAHPPSGSVSIRALQHPPARKAVDRFLKAQKYSGAGDHARSAEALEQAIRISPQYAEAHLNLGAQYLHQERWEESLAESTRALDLAGPSTMALCNMAYAESHLKRVDEALDTLRRALALDARSAQAHFLMGLLLAGQPDRRPEALEHLEFAAQSMPSARSAADQLRGLIARTPPAAKP